MQVQFKLNNWDVSNQHTGQPDLQPTDNLFYICHRGHGTFTELDQAFLQQIENVANISFIESILKSDTNENDDFNAITLYHFHQLITPIYYYLLAWFFWT